MANVKNITNLPMAESTEGLNFIVNDNGAAKQIAADKIGSGGATSWNDLKDKPFGEEVGVLFDGTVDINDNYGEFTLLSPMINGNEYTVTFNGTEYTRVYEDDGFYISLPNDDYIDIWNGGLENSVFPNETITLKIEGNVVKPLDEKFIPDSIKGSNYDFIINISFNDYSVTAKDGILVHGDFNAIYNKLQNKEFVNGIAYGFYERAGRDVCKYITVLEIGCNDWEDDISVRVEYESGSYFEILPNNTVVCWTVD